MIYQLKNDRKIIKTHNHNHNHTTTTVDYYYSPQVTVATVTQSEFKPECLCDEGGWGIYECYCNADRLSEVYHEMIFSVSKNDIKSQTKNPTITCDIKMYIKKDSDFVDGQTITWKEYHDERTAKQSFTSFDFTFTTNDSETTFFEPYIDTFEMFFSLKCAIRSDFIRLYLAKDTKVKKVKKKEKKSKKSKKKTRECSYGYSDLKVPYGELVLNRMSYKSENIRYVQPISTTLANVLIKNVIDSEKLYDFGAAEEQIECPHMKAPVAKYRRKR